MAGNLVPSIKFIKGNSKHPLVPGVCIIDDRYKFYFNKVISDGEASPVSLFYQCGSKKISKFFLLSFVFFHFKILTIKSMSFVH